MANNIVVNGENKFKSFDVIYDKPSDSELINSAIQSDKKLKITENTEQYLGSCTTNKQNVTERTGKDLRNCKYIQFGEIKQENEELSNSSLAISKHNFRTIKSEKNLDKLLQPRLKQSSIRKKRRSKHMIYSNDSLNDNHGYCESRPKRVAAKRACKAWLNNNNNNNDDDNISSSINNNVVSETPIWAEHLNNPRIINAKWLIGVCYSREEVDQNIEDHSRYILANYVRSHPSATRGDDLTKSQSSRLMWQHSQIHFDGIPFKVNSNDERQCNFGLLYKAKKGKSKNGACVKNISLSSDEVSLNCLVDTERKSTNLQLLDDIKRDKICYKNVNYTACPAKISIRALTKYPNFAIPMNATHTDKKNMLKRLRSSMLNSLDCGDKEMFYIIFPLQSCHNHELTGSSRNVHPSIVQEIKNLIQQGTTSARLVQDQLKIFVENTFSSVDIIPQLSDRAFYPGIKDIENIIYPHRKKLGFSHRKKNVANSQTTYEDKLKKRSNKNKVSSSPKEDLSNIVIESSGHLENIETLCSDETEHMMTKTPNFVEIINNQLDQIRHFTYSNIHSASLDKVYQSLQSIIDHQINQPNNISIESNNLLHVEHYNAAMHPSTEHYCLSVNDNQEDNNGHSIVNSVNNPLYVEVSPKKQKLISNSIPIKNSLPVLHNTISNATYNTNNNINHIGLVVNNNQSQDDLNSDNLLNTIPIGHNNQVSSNNISPTVTIIYQPSNSTQQNGNSVQVTPQHVYYVQEISEPPENGFLAL